MADKTKGNTFSERDLITVLLGLQDDVSELKQRGELPNLARAVVVAQELAQSINTYEASAAGVGLKAAAALQEIREAGTAFEKKAEGVTARIENSKKSVTSQTQMMQEVRAEAQIQLEEIRTMLAEVTANQQRLSESQKKVLDLYSEVIGKLDADAIRDAAEEAAKEAFVAMNKEAIKTEVQRQIRLLNKAA